MASARWPSSRRRGRPRPSSTGRDGRSERHTGATTMSEKAVFRWACLAVAAAALAALGWMLNDMRLQVRELAESANKQLNEVQGLTTKASTILTQTERVTAQLDDKVPKILKQAERVTSSMDQHLPK